MCPFKKIAKRAKLLHPTQAPASLKEGVSYRTQPPTLCSPFDQTECTESTSIFDCRSSNDPNMFFFFSLIKFFLLNEDDIELIHNNAYSQEWSESPHKNRACHGFYFLLFGLEATNVHSITSASTANIFLQSLKLRHK